MLEYNYMAQVSSYAESSASDSTKLKIAKVSVNLTRVFQGKRCTDDEKAFGESITSKLQKLPLSAKDNAVGRLEGIFESSVNKETRARARAVIEGIVQEFQPKQKSKKKQKNAQWRCGIHFIQAMS